MTDEGTRVRVNDNGRHRLQIGPFTGTQRHPPAGRVTSHMVHI